MADNVVKFRIDTKEYDANLKRAGQALSEYMRKVREGGGSLKHLDDGVMDAVKSLNNMGIKAESTRGRIAEMTKTFTELRMQYKQMSAEEKASPVGKALDDSLRQLNTRIQQTKTDLRSVEQELSGSKFGQFGGVLDGIGKKMGLNVNVTELLTSKTALMSAGIGAATAIIGKATSEWAKYNAELAKQDQITTVTTGLQGPGADRMTDQSRALVDTYNVDFREVINAANTLMTQFGESGEGAMTLIRDGMRGMIQGDGPKLLSMIQQYAPSFRDAGISASQLVAIIQNSEGGIFTDQNMNAIVMGIKNIRLMTNATSEALAKMGIDGQEMTRKLNDGSMTIFEAMQKVSNAINQSGSASQAAGEVMQQVFGRQGAAAGTKLGEAIATLNTNLEETKRQTGELGDAYDDLYEANVKLNGAIRDCFEYDGWEQMATGIKAKLVTALALVVDKLAEIKRELGGGWNTPKSGTVGDRKTGGGSLIDDALKRLGSGNTQGQQRMFTNQLNEYSRYITNLRKQQQSLIDEANSDVSGATYQINERTIRNIGNLITAAEKNRDEYMRRANEIFKKGIGKTFNGREWVGDGMPTKIDIDTKPAQQSVDDLRKKLKELNKERREAVKVGDQGRVDSLTRQINQTKTNLGYLTGGGNGGGSGTTSIMEKMSQMWEQAFTRSVAMSDTFVNPNETEASEVWKAISQEAETTVGPLQKMREELAYLTKSLDEAASPEAYQDIKKVIEGKQRQIADFTGEMKPQKMEDKTATELSKISGNMTKVTSGIGNIFSGVQQMGIEIPKEINSVIGVVNGISAILMGISALLTLINGKQDVQIFTNILPMARGGVVPHAAMGYYVPGTHRSGDVTPIMANAGELVLNESSQGTLAADLLQARGLLESIERFSPMLSMAAQSSVVSQMQGGVETLKLEAYVQGEQLHLVHNRFLKRSGQGELATWK